MGVCYESVINVVSETFCIRVCPGLWSGEDVEHLMNSVVIHDVLNNDTPHRYSQATKEGMHGT